MTERAVIDLRTDTITVPSPAMRAAIASAPVGDDFYHEDPTVKALEARAAAIMGKDAALYVPSGTMANLLAHLTHCPGGAEVIGPEPAHSFVNEGGGPARVAGVTPRTFPQVGGALDLGRIAGLIHRASVLSQATGLLWAEVPTRGHLVPLDDLAGLRQLADRHGVPVHFDGARIFNQAIAMGLPAADIAAYADSLMFCVSKGLGASVGSLLVGTVSFIERARLGRQMLGGGMRQAGIIAAAGLYALDHHIDRLAEDHANARRLATGLRAIHGLRLDRDVVETNIFYVEIIRDDLTAAEAADRLRDSGVLVNRPSSGRRLRFVTHIGVDAADIEEAIDRAAMALASGAPTGRAAPATSGTTR